MVAVFEGIAAAGKRCPDDVLVVGVGNGIMEPLFRPPLTSVYLDAEGCARDLAGLVERLIGGGPPEHIEFAWELIERGSTSRAAARTR